jgi:hypothetical protein
VCAHYAKTRMVGINLNTANITDVLLDMVQSGYFYPAGSFLTHRATLDVSKANRALRMVLAPHLTTANDIHGVFFGGPSIVATRYDTDGYAPPWVSQLVAALQASHANPQVQAAVGQQPISGPRPAASHPSPHAAAAAAAAASSSTSAIHAPDLPPRQRVVDPMAERRCAMEIEAMVQAAEAAGMGTLQGEDRAAFQAVLASMRQQATP